MIAHSAPKGKQPHTYQSHVEGVVRRAHDSAAAMLEYCREPETAIRMRAILEDAAPVHDLGKLDPEVQDALYAGPQSKLPWDHVDAGVAALMNGRSEGAAWLVRGHHAPGLPQLAEHFPSPKLAYLNLSSYRKLRGRRHSKSDADHRAQIARTDERLADLIVDHEQVCGPIQLTANRAIHGLKMRLMQSCLVDADHGDTAGSDLLPAIPPRWQERLESLDRYVQGLSRDRDDPRSEQRREFYRTCRHSDTENVGMISCDGPVGIGKTTAVMAWLLRRAIRTDARRIIVVAPFTSILSQSAQVLRDALVLPDEQKIKDSVIAEHHHRADFSDPSSRGLATLWRAPIVLTTSVQFFETLAANQPARLRKLHALPGSVVFIDEAHAALPIALWAQNWKWLNMLAEDWECSFVFGSGSLVRFWEVEQVIGDRSTTLPDLVPKDLAKDLQGTERSRITYRTLGVVTLDSLIREVTQMKGPRLLILNTLEGAARTASLMRRDGHDVLHLSTALSPRDRNRILERVISKLADPDDQDWTLVATSLIESGVDLSFRAGFRERFSVCSLVQTGGRVNRHGEYDQGVVADFVLRSDTGVGQHPAAKLSGPILKRYFEKHRLDGAFDVAMVVTEAIKEEALSISDSRKDLVEAESSRDYPRVAELGRVIQEDARLVVVDTNLKSRLESEEFVPSPELLLGSVQIRKEIIDRRCLSRLETRREIYWWHYAYDAEFLGFMRGALDHDDDDLSRNQSQC